MQHRIYESCLIAALLIVLTLTRQRINNSENTISPQCIVLSVAVNKCNFSVVSKQPCKHETQCCKLSGYP